MSPQAENHGDGQNDHPQQLEQVDAATGKAEQAAAQVIEREDRRWLDVPEIDVELPAFVKSTRVGQEQRLIPVQGYFQPEQACDGNYEER